MEADKLMEPAAVNALQGIYKLQQEVKLGKHLMAEGLELHYPICIKSIEKNVKQTLYTPKQYPRDEFYIMYPMRPL